MYKKRSRKGTITILGSLAALILVTLYYTFLAPKKSSGKKLETYMEKKRRLAKEESSQNPTHMDTENKTTLNKPYEPQNYTTYSNNTQYDDGINKDTGNSKLMILGVLVIGACVAFIIYVLKKG